MACTARHISAPASGWRVGLVSLLLAVVVPISTAAQAAADTAAAPQQAQAVESDDWDMGWEDLAPTPGYQSGAADSGAPAPAEPAATRSDEAAIKSDEAANQSDNSATRSDATAIESDDKESTTEAASGADDWDWDWEETDSGPTYKSDTSRRVEPGAASMPTVPRVGETAMPDFSASPISGHLLFADVPGFGVIPSIKDKGMHPCSNCHTWAKSNLTPRRLKRPHDNFLLQHGLHGQGEFWCFTCHHLDGAGGLRTLEGERLSFDDAYILCAQCHPGETRDWSFGAHGKRVDNWQGNRRILNCTACHYQHRPNIKPRKAVPPPPVRRGLVNNDHKPHVEAPLWDRIGARYRDTGSAGRR